MTVTITRERPDTPDATALVAELDEYLLPLYPIESHHGLDVHQLIAEQVAFFVLRVDGAAAGCGGVRFCGSEYGEIKRMYIRPDYRGQGLSKLMVQHLEAYTHAQGVRTLRLETGILQYDAIGLYRCMGFVEIRHFGAYWDDPLSLFFEKQLGG